MPYVQSSDRQRVSRQLAALAKKLEGQPVGVYNYTISRLVDDFLCKKGLSYANINQMIGMLECVKLELYRRVAGPYETAKQHTNGEVYLSLAKGCGGNK